MSLKIAALKIMTIGRISGPTAALQFNLFDINFTTLDQ